MYEVKVHCGDRLLDVYAFPDRVDAEAKCNSLKRHLPPSYSVTTEYTGLSVESESMTDYEQRVAPYVFDDFSGPISGLCKDDIDALSRAIASLYRRDSDSDTKSQLVALLSKRYGQVVDQTDYLEKLKTYLEEPNLCVYEFGSGEVFDEHDQIQIASITADGDVLDMDGTFVRDLRDD